MAPSLDEETVEKVIRQVEFYFSDNNLHFLKKTINQSEDGLVSLATICSFPRMRGHLGLGDLKNPEGLPEDTKKAVAESLRTSVFLMVSEDGEKVGRVTEFPKPDKAKENTAKDFDIELVKEEEESAKTLPQVGSMDDEPSYPKDLVVAFTLKTKEEVSEDLKSEAKDSDVVFRGDLKTVFGKFGTLEFIDFNSGAESGYVRFENAEGAQKACAAAVLAEEGGLTVKNFVATVEPVTGDVEKEYWSRVRNNQGKHRGSLKSNRGRGGRHNKRGRKTLPQVGSMDDEPSYPKDLVVAFTLKTKEEVSEDLKAEAKDSDVVVRGGLKTVFGKFGTLEFIDFNSGAESGYVRFENAEGAQKARAAAVLAEEGGLTVKNFVATVEPVTGDVEKEYWSRLRNNQGKHRGSLKSNRGRGGRHNKRGRRHFGGKHSTSRDYDSTNCFQNQVTKEVNVDENEFSFTTIISKKIGNEFFIACDGRTTFPDYTIHSGDCNKIRSINKEYLMTFSGVCDLADRETAFLENMSKQSVPPRDILQTVEQRIKDWGVAHGGPKPLVLCMHGISKDNKCFLYEMGGDIAVDEVVDEIVYVTGSGQEFAIEKYKELVEAKYFDKADRLKTIRVLYICIAYAVTKDIRSGGWLNNGHVSLDAICVGPFNQRRHVISVIAEFLGHLNHLAFSYIVTCAPNDSAAEVETFRQHWTTKPGVISAFIVGRNLEHKIEVWIIEARSDFERPWNCTEVIDVPFVPRVAKLTSKNLRMLSQRFFNVVGKGV